MTTATIREDSIIRGAYNNTPLGNSLAHLRRVFNAAITSGNLKKAMRVAAMATAMTKDVQWQTAAQVCRGLLGMQPT